MSDFPSSSKPSAQLDNEISTVRLSMFRRRFQCGHPDEFIEAIRNYDGERVHNLATFATFEAIRRHYGGLPAYTQARCLNCAKVAKEKDDLSPEVRRKKTLGTYQVVFTSTEPEDVLTRYRYSADRGSVQPHARVSEAEHYVHRIDMLRKAVNSADNWVAIPARRVQNVPVRMKAAARLAPRRRELSIFEEDNGADGLKETDYCKSESIVEAVETIHELSESQHSSNVGSIDESYHMAAVKCENSSTARRARHTAILAAGVTQSQPSLIAADGEEVRAEDAISLITSHESHVGRHNAYHESSLDALSDLNLTGPEVEERRPALAIPSVSSSPKKGALYFIRRRSSTSAWGLSRSASRKMEFRKLGIDFQPTISFGKTDLDSDSPDWACQTSRAIEAGRVSMESVNQQGRELMKSKHVPQERSTGRRNTYPLPAGDRSPVSPLHVRHSEGAPQALRVNASHRHGRLVGMEITSPKETSKHDNTQGALVVDLNKRLPALPSQAGREHGEDQGESI